MSASNQFFHSLFIGNVFTLLSFVKDNFDLYRLLGWIWFNRILLLFLSLGICHFIVLWLSLFQMRSRPLIVSISLLAIFSFRLHNFHFVFYYINVSSFFSLFSVQIRSFLLIIFRFTYVSSSILNLLFSPSSEFFIFQLLYFSVPEFLFNSVL